MELAKGGAGTVILRAPTAVALYILNEKRTSSTGSVHTLNWKSAHAQFLKKIDPKPQNKKLFLATENRYLIGIILNVRQSFFSFRNVVFLTKIW
jgi:hypothetical protein